MTEPQTFRFPTDLVDHLAQASEKSEIPRVRLVIRAVRDFLNREFPECGTAAATEQPTG